jgi:hypothetical protein
MRLLASFGDYAVIDNPEQADGAYLILSNKLMDEIAKAGYANYMNSNIYIRNMRILKPQMVNADKPLSEPTGKYTIGCRFDVLEYDTKLLRPECRGCACRTCKMEPTCENGCSACGDDPMKGFNSKDLRGRFVQTGDKEATVLPGCDKYREYSADLPD